MYIMLLVANVDFADCCLLANGWIVRCNGRPDHTTNSTQLGKTCVELSRVRRVTKPRGVFTRYTGVTYRYAGACAGCLHAFTVRVNIKGICNPI
jgi:hypothetical protein